MKHGPIALIDQNMPVVCLAPRDPWHEKMISQIQQAKARGGIVVAVATDGDELVEALVDHVLRVPPTPWMLSPVVTVLPLRTTGLSHCHAAGPGRGSAEESGQECDGGVACGPVEARQNAGWPPWGTYVRAQPGT
jgi:glucosamine 6-phosphate synthetase-like amidotransferase/phosphosugar isomerase protein